MPSLKDLSIKITGIKKTEQITKAMNMVAAAKMRGAQERMEQFRPYAGKFEAVMGQLSGGANSNASPLMEVRDVKKIVLLVVTSDRGLCGAFNANILKASNRFLAGQKADGKEAVTACIGKKGFSNFKKTEYTVVHSAVDCMADIQMADARKAGQEIIRMFLENEIDEAHLVYGKFINVAIQRPSFKKLLPISPEGLSAETPTEESEGAKATYIYEPAPEEILTQLLPMYINVQVMAAMLETGASEQAARMTAMDNATRACQDMIGELSLTYNKARQGAITTELMDIVGGAEALKG